MENVSNLENSMVESVDIAWQCIHSISYILPYSHVNVYQDIAHISFPLSIYFQLI